MSLKVATLKDLDFITSCQMKMAKETENIDLDKDVLKRGVLKVLEQNGPEVYYVFEQDNEKKACMLTIPEWSEWRNKNALWIHSVYVIEKERKKGIFKAMYKQLKKLVVENEDIHALRLYVDKTNTAAQKTYESLGMNNQHYLLYEWNT